MSRSAHSGGHSREQERQYHVNSTVVWWVVVASRTLSRVPQCEQTVGSRNLHRDPFRYASPDQVPHGRAPISHAECDGGIPRRARIPRRLF
jgi:hypothetical protein